MGAPVWPNDQNCTMAELQTAMKASPTQKGYKRMLAIEALFRGNPHGQVASIFNITRETLAGWVREFNHRGIDGLVDAPRSGRPRAISAEETDRYRQLIDKPEQAGHAHWTATKFHGYLRTELEHEIGYRTVVRWLHEQGYRLKVPQPWPDRQDERAREAFVEKLRAWLADADIDLWYQDEMGVEGDPRPRRRWIQKGEKGRVIKNGDHLRMNVSGMVNPRTGRFFALELSHSDRETFQIYLDEANREIAFERPRNFLIMDNASWHKVKSLSWGRFEPIYLPAYSPDLNPIERLWLVIKAEWFTDFVAKSYEQLIARLDAALCWVINRAELNQRTCRIKAEL
jgi:transposase